MSPVHFTGFLLWACSALLGSQDSAADERQWIRDLRSTVRAESDIARLEAYRQFWATAQRDGSRASAKVTKALAEGLEDPSLAVRTGVLPLLVESPRRGSVALALANAIRQNQREAKKAHDEFLKSLKSLGGLLERGLGGVRDPIAEFTKNPKALERMLEETKAMKATSDEYKSAMEARQTYAAQLLQHAGEHPDDRVVAAVVDAARTNGPWGVDNLELARCLLELGTRSAVGAAAGLTELDDEAGEASRKQVEEILALLAKFAEELGLEPPVRGDARGWRAWCGEHRSVLPNKLGRLEDGEDADSGR